MLRELIERTSLEDFVSGLARACNLRAVVYDSRGDLLAASLPVSGWALLRGALPERLPRPIEFTTLPADAPPAAVAFLLEGGVAFVLAPVHAGERVAGYVMLGEFRDPAAAPPTELETWRGAGEPLAGETPLTEPPRPARGGAAEAAAVGAQLAGPPSADSQRLRRAWEALPELRRSGDAHAVVSARWASRVLGEACRREQSLDTALDELALLGDIGALLSGSADLESVLKQVVAETARVLKCTACSMRLYDAESDELRIAAAYNLSPGYVNKGAVLRSENPIDDEALRGQLVTIEDVTRDARIRFPEEAQREGIVSGLTAGMLHRGEPIGVLRVYTNRRWRFRASQRHLLRAVATQAATTIVNARLAQDRIRAARMEQQLALAGELQTRLMGTPPPKFAPVESALIFDPSGHVGGDLADFLILPDGRLAAIVADVMGHGVHASLLTAYTRGAFRANAAACSDLGVLLSRLNDQLCGETNPNEFVSLLLVAVSRDGRRLSFCNAGHEPPMILRRGEIERPEEAGLVLGLQPGEAYVETHADVGPGDAILLFTDGATEAMNFEGQQYGRDRLRDSLLQYGALPPRPLLASMHWDIRRFVGLAEQSDDLTLLALRIRAAATT